MGYVDHTPATFSSSSEKSALLYSLDAGVNYSLDSLSVSDNQASEIRNMWLENGIITSRPAMVKLESKIEGTKINSSSLFLGNIIIHSGTKLYRLSNDNTCTELLNGLYDDISVPVYFYGELYIFNKDKIFVVNRDMVAEERIPYAPLYMTSCDDKKVTGTKVSDFEPNIFAPYVAISYRSALVSDIDGGVYQYAFPQDIDRNRKFEIYFEDRLLKEGEYELTDERFKLINLKQKEFNTVVLKYYCTDEKLQFGDDVQKCTIGAAFGGGTLEGTRIFLSGNSEKPGRYYTSELENGVYFKENSGGVIGQGIENVVAFTKQYGYLLAFTANTVSRIDYNFDSENGGYYAVKTISSNVGSDMPKSLAVVDNRTVFANSTGGIFIVDTIEYTDNLNIVPISRNITDSSAKKGFFSISDEELKKAVGCIFERKYMLLAGNTIFIWDFGESAYVSSADYVKSAKRLVWFEFSVPCETNFIVSSDKNLYLVQKDDDENSTVFTFDKSAHSDIQTDYGFRSKNIDMSLPHTKKTVSTIKFQCKTEREMDVTLKFYADGKVYYTKELHVVPDIDGYADIYLKLPRYVLDRFAFEIEGNTACSGFFNIGFDYTILKNNLKK